MRTVAIKKTRNSLTGLPDDRQNNKKWQVCADFFLLMAGIFYKMRIVTSWEWPMINLMRQGIR
jgi:hypothetical protein